MRERRPKREIATATDSSKKLLIEMFSLAKSILNKAITAFKNKEFKLASKIEKIDDKVDDTQKAIIKKLYSSTFSSEENIKIIADISLVIRYLERIGDHSVSIGERVQYFLTGDYKVFHSDN